MTEEENEEFIKLDYWRSKSTLAEEEPWVSDLQKKLDEQQSILENLRKKIDDSESEN